MRETYYHDFHEWEKPYTQRDKDGNIPYLPGLWYHHTNGASEYISDFAPTISIDNIFKGNRNLVLNLRNVDRLPKKASLFRLYLDRHCKVTIKAKVEDIRARNVTFSILEVLKIEDRD